MELWGAGTPGPHGALGLVAQHPWGLPQDPMGLWVRYLTTPVGLHGGASTLGPHRALGVVPQDPWGLPQDPHGAGGGASTPGPPGEGYPKTPWGYRDCTPAPLRGPPGVHGAMGQVPHNLYRAGGCGYPRTPMGGIPQSPFGAGGWGGYPKTPREGTPGRRGANRACSPGPMGVPQDPNAAMGGQVPQDPHGRGTPGPLQSWGVQVPQNPHGDPWPSAPHMPHWGSLRAVGQSLPGARGTMTPTSPSPAPC